MIAWRLCDRAFSGRDILNGEGANEYGGRWNEPGLPLIYATTSVSLGILEQLAQSTRMPKSYIAVQITMPDDAPGQTITIDQLPANWNDVDNPECIAMGSQWTRARSGLWLKVPSAVNSLEHNVLINPKHLHIMHCAVSDPINVITDPRSWKSSRRPNPQRKRRRANNSCRAA